MSPDLNLETLFKEPRALPPTERTHAWEVDRRQQPQRELER